LRQLGNRGSQSVQQLQQIAPPPASAKEMWTFFRGFFALLV